MTAVSRILSLGCLLVGLALPVAAQSPFQAVARVNDSVVTDYDLDQRIRFLTLLQAPADVRRQALDQLVDERLQLQAAQREGIVVSDEALADGMAEFAARADLSTGEFLGLLSEGGVSREAFEDFVRAGIAWRQTVQARFGPQISIREDEIDDALLGEPDTELRVLISEIVLPANTPQRAEQARALAEELSGITSQAEFAEAARRYSAAPTADRGGVVDWRPLDSLPPPVAQQFLEMRPGEVTAPLEVQNAVAVFQLRALDERRGGEDAALIDYARYLIPQGRTEEARAEAAHIAARVDTCDDLYGVAQGQPARRLLRDEVPMAQLPAAHAQQVAGLDAGEISTTLSEDGTLEMLMLCSRNYTGEPVPEDGSDLQQARNAALAQLRGARLSDRADLYLERLRADAVIQRGQ